MYYVIIILFYCKIQGKNLKIMESVTIMENATIMESVTYGKCNLWKM